MESVIILTLTSLVMFGGVRREVVHYLEGLDLE
jgi:hypothetical protein